MDFEIPRRQILHKTLFSELILGVDVRQPLSSYTHSRLDVSSIKGFI